MMAHNASLTSGLFMPQSTMRREVQSGAVSHDLEDSELRLVLQLAFKGRHVLEFR
jgi:hypothetical protein